MVLVTTGVVVVVISEVEVISVVEVTGVVVEVQ